MISLSTTLTLSLSWTHTDSDALTNQSVQGSLLYEKELDNYLPGSGLDKASLAFSEVGTLAASTQKIFDLQSLTGIFLSGQIIFGLDKLKILAVRNLSENSGYTLNIGGAPSNPFTGHFSSGNAILSIGADSAMCVSNKKNGYDVSASSRFSRIHNPNASGLTYHIVIIGQSG